MKKEKKPTTLTGKSLDFEIMAGLVQSDDFFYKLFPVLEETDFEDKESKLIFNVYSELLQKTNEKPTFTTVYYKLDKVEGIELSTLEAARKLLQESYDARLPDEEILLEEIEKEIRKKRSMDTLLEVLYDFQEKPTDKALESLEHSLEACRRAATFSTDTSVGMSLTNDSERRWDYYTNPEHRISLGMNSLDRRTGGGAPRKTLNAVMAATNVGKTMFLSSLALNYFRQNYNVLYVTLEIREEELLKRMDANLIETNLSEFHTLTKEIYDKKFKQAISSSRGSITVKEFPAGQCSVNNLRSLLHDLQGKQDIKVDVLVVDYLGLMRSINLSKGKSNSYDYQKAITEELRGLCMEKDLVGWTAMQTNRSGVNSEDLDLDKAADSFGIPMTMDYVLSAWRTPEGDQEGILFVNESKSRYGNKMDCPIIRLECDTEQQRISDKTPYTGGQGGIKQLREEREKARERNDKTKALLSSKHKEEEELMQINENEDKDEEFVRLTNNNHLFSKEQLEADTTLGVNKEELTKRILTPNQGKVYVPTMEELGLTNDVVKTIGLYLQENLPEWSSLDVKRKKTAVKTEQLYRIGVYPRPKTREQIEAEKEEQIRREQEQKEQEERERFQRRKESLPPMKKRNKDEEKQELNTFSKEKVEEDDTFSKESSSSSSLVDFVQGVVDQEDFGKVIEPEEGNYALYKDKEEVERINAYMFEKKELEERKQSGEFDELDAALEAASLEEENIPNHFAVLKQDYDLAVSSYQRKKTSWVHYMPRHLPPNIPEELKEILTEDVIGLEEYPDGIYRGVDKLSDEEVRRLRKQIAPYLKKRMELVEEGKIHLKHYNPVKKEFIYNGGS